MLPQAYTDDFMQIRKSAPLSNKLEKGLCLGGRGSAVGLGEQILPHQQPWPRSSGHTEL